MTKKLFALTAFVVFICGAAFLRAGAARLPVGDVAKAQAPTPTVSVTTLPAMPGKPTHRGRAVRRGRNCSLQYGILAADDEHVYVAANKLAHCRH